jgi:hypothetical protein
MDELPLSIPGLFRDELVEDPTYLVYLSTDTRKVYAITEEDVDKNIDTYFIKIQENVHSFKSNELIELIMQRNLEKEDVIKEVCDQRPILSILQAGVPDPIQSFYIVYH